MNHLFAPLRLGTLGRRRATSAGTRARKRMCTLHEVRALVSMRLPCPATTGDGGPRRLPWPQVVTYRYMSPPQATKALDGYRNLLHVISPARTALLAALIQHKCPFDSAGTFAGYIVRLNAELPKVLAALRAAKTGLVAKCVVPSRRLSPSQMARVE